MSDLLIALLLGTIQGLTEFLPVSSSGHLAIVQGFIGDKWLGDVLFNVSVHLGTTLAVIVFFHKDILGMIRGILPGTYQRQQGIVVMCILITTIVTGIVGISFKDSFDAMFSMPKLAAGMLLVTGFLTFFTDRIRKPEQKYGRIRIRDAVIIGAFQSLAIIPGISRSGSTIFAGVLCGMERTWAASYSFIAAIPAVIGAVILEWGGTTQPLTWLHIIGGVTAFIVGLISLQFLVWTLKKHNFFIFSVYCWLAGLTYLALSI
ncbi:MAG TPA: undecaprenyl-diphosphate phosphatase [Deltaproteobacteria bacterium]|nr:undecaprenyl-diphosphate phosphatase [Deltaproteobacteria bacterium]